MTLDLGLATAIKGHFSLCLLLPSWRVRVLLYAKWVINGAKDTPFSPFFIFSPKFANLFCVFSYYDSEGEKPTFSQGFEGGNAMNNCFGNLLGDNNNSCCWIIIIALIVLCCCCNN